MNRFMTRREFVQLGLLSGAGLVLVGCGANDAPGQQEEAAVDYPTATAVSEAIQLAPTPQCDDHDETPAQTEGPFYTPSTPERTSFLEAGIVGTPLLVTGKVLSTDCQPMAGALLDFWHADDGGNYDNEGFKLRGHQYTDAEGNFTLETIVPGLYPGRTRHIHVKVQGQEMALLTTQLYFPGEPDNATDGIFAEELLMDVADEGEGKTAVFNFVLG
ncbi:MAG: intradiol ring-cleavage dioxygenase [Chloroflexota bacterium]